MQSRISHELNMSTFENLFFQFRIGGGFRHSYWFVRQLIDKAKEEEEKQLALLSKEQKAIFSQKLAWRVGKDGKSKFFFKVGHFRCKKDN